MNAEWYVYLLTCSDDTYYCGIAKDINKRLKAHNLGKGARYTRGRRPTVLVWRLAEPLSLSQALRLERRLKSMSRSQKMSFVQNVSIQNDFLSEVSSNDAS